MNYLKKIFFVILIIFCPKTLHAFGLGGGGSSFARVTCIPELHYIEIATLYGYVEKKNYESFDNNNSEILKKHNLISTDELGLSPYKIECEMPDGKYEFSIVPIYTIEKYENHTHACRGNRTIILNAKFNGKNFIKDLWFDEDCYILFRIYLLTINTHSGYYKIFGIKDNHTPSHRPPLAINESFKYKDRINSN